MSATEEYKCPCCGGAIRFDASLQKMKCPYCDTEFDVDTLRNYNENAGSAKGDDHAHWETQAGTTWQNGETEGLKVYSCGSCGAEIISPETTGASMCPYCGNPIVMTGTFSGTLRPDAVIPFKLDKAAAENSYRAYLKGKRLLPKKFFNENHIDEIQGIYVPFWLFNGVADGDVTYRATKVRKWSDSFYDYTETNYYSLQRQGTVAFSDVPADGSEKMADDLMESIEPYDNSQAADFNTAYLSGFLADKFDVDAEVCEQRADARIKASTEEAFAQTALEYDSVAIEESTIRVKDGKARYLLYPVWLLHTEWKGKPYLFAMNGQTGKFVGDLPLSRASYWKWFGFYTLFGTIMAYTLALLISLFF